MLDRRFFLFGLLASNGAVAQLLAQVAKHRSTSSRPGLPSFVDVTARSGIKFKNNASHTSEKYLIETMGGGVAMFDYNGDGLLDLFFVNGVALGDPMAAGKVPDKSDPKFWNRLYRNTGDGTFTDVTRRASVAGGGWSASACFVDHDRDGFLALIVSRYLEWDFSENIYCGKRKPGYRAYCNPDIFPPVAHLIYHNNGDGTFTEVSRKCGLASSPGRGLALPLTTSTVMAGPTSSLRTTSSRNSCFKTTETGPLRRWDCRPASPTMARARIFRHGPGFPGLR